MSILWTLPMVPIQKQKCLDGNPREPPTAHRKTTVQNRDFQVFLWSYNISPKAFLEMGKHETNHENSPIKNDEDFIWPNYHKDCSEIFGVFLGSKYGTDLVQCHTGYNTGRMTTWVPNGSVNNRYTWRRWPSRWNWRNIWWVFLLLGKKSCLASKKFGTQGQEYLTGSLTKTKQ